MTYSNRRILNFILIAVTALSIYYYATCAERSWLLWSALILSLLRIGDTLPKRMLTIGFTAIIATLVTLIAGSINFFTPYFSLFLFFITMLCIYIAEKYPDYFFPAVVINLFALVSGLMPSEWFEELDRGLFILLGAAIVLFFQLIDGPYLIRHQMRILFRSALSYLHTMNHSIFLCLLDAEYATNVYPFERKLHDQKNKIAKLMARLRLLLHVFTQKKAQDESKRMQEMLQKLNALYESMLDYSLIRRRVSDHSIFGICSMELKVLDKEIAYLLKQLMKVISGKKNMEWNTDGLSQAIQRFEENFNQVLQISAREPIVFLLFIFSLKSFQQALVEMYAASLGS